ncbi:DUF6691 family protein [Paracidovorax wautersii]|jgi:hypothetical protein|uniref:DUF6691 family protein n=1 Tax=Paracidovorax wautersii TaxID=1177982 RepID=UPI003EB8BE20
MAAVTVAFAAARKRSQTLLGEPVRWPNARAIDRLASAACCSVSVGALRASVLDPVWWRSEMGESKALVFTAAMLTGMIVFEGIERRKSLRAEPAI